MTAKYYAFQIESHLLKGGDFVLGHEKLADMLSELRVLHEQHYNETETLYMNEPFDPNYASYAESERNGKFVVFTVRRASGSAPGEMVGYLQYYVFRSLHSQNMLQGREDAFYLSKAVRGGGLAPALLKYAEHCLAQLGCTHVGMSSKAPAGGPDLDAFLRRQDYKPVAVYYAKKLGVADAQTDSAKAA